MVETMTEVVAAPASQKYIFFHKLYLLSIYLVLMILMLGILLKWWQVLLVGWSLDIIILSYKNYY